MGRLHFFSKSIYRKCIDILIISSCGPHKLAATFHRCLTRLNALANDPKKYSDTDPVQPEVPGNAEAMSTSNNSRGLQKQDSYIDQVESPQARLERKFSEKEDRPQSPPMSPRPENLGSDMGTSQGPLSTANSRNLSRTSSYDANPISASEDDSNPQSPVLLVDDNDINLKLLVAFMKKARHPYVTAKDGLQAVQAYEKASADSQTAVKYILMDISMPVMDGIESTKAIRQYERKEGIKERAVIIALTGLSMESTRKEMMEVGADYFLSKPVKFKDLIQLLGP